MRVQILRRCGPEGDVIACSATLTVGLCATRGFQRAENSKTKRELTASKYV